MSTTPVTDTRVTVSDRPVPNQSVVAELGGTVDGSWRVLEGRAADGHVVGRERVFTDSSGHWVLPLIPNSEITPTGTTYRLTEPTGVHYIIVPVAVLDADGKPIPVSAGDLYTVDPPQPVMPLPGQGPAGPPFVVKGNVANQAALPSTGEPGQGWVTSDTGHVWAWDPAVPGWVDAGQFQGTPGVGLEYQWVGDQLEVRPEGSTGAWSPSPHLTGTPGTAATIAIDPSSGGVPHGTPTSVENVGTVNAAILKFLIEQAQDGSQILTGTGTPTGTPPDGTLFLDTGNGNVWRYSAGAWSGAPVLNIMGPAGSPTAFELRGTGFPEGVVTASPGTYYTDTAGTNGAWRWLKTSGSGNTGWVVTVGDTGWRDVTNPAYFSAGIAKIKRMQNTIAAQFIGVVYVATGGHPIVMDISAGFSPNVPKFPSWGSGAPAGRMGGNATQNKLFTYSSNNSRLATVGGFYATDGAQSGAANWLTDDAWPTTLPGTPA